MSIFRDFFVKEKPVFTGITRGIGGFGFGGGASGPTSPGEPFTGRLVVVGGGGGGGSGQGSGAGAGGGVLFNTFAFTVGSPNNFTVGSGGSPGGPGNNANGSDASASVWGPSLYTIGGGGGGGAPGTSGRSGLPAGGSGGGGGNGGGGGPGGAIPGSQSPFVFGNRSGGSGHSGPGGSGGNQGGGAGGAGGNGGDALGPGTPGTKGGGAGGAGKVIPADYFPDAFTATGGIGSGSTSDQFLGMAVTQPAENRRTFGGGGGGGSEIGNFTNSSGGAGGGGHGGYGAPPNPGSGDAPPAGPPGISPGPTSGIFKGEPGYDGRGGGAGGGGYTNSTSWGGRGGCGLVMIQAPADHDVEITMSDATHSPYATQHVFGDKRYIVITANANTHSVSGEIVFS